MICQLFSLSDSLTLPVELFVQILQYCEIEDLARLALVSKDYYVLASDEQIWKAIFEKKFPSIEDKKLQAKLDSVCCSKHKYSLMERRRKNTVQDEGTKSVAEVKKGDIVILHGKCCRIVQVSQIRSGKH